jgi:hypothetical protein
LAEIHCADDGGPTGPGERLRVETAVGIEALGFEPRTLVLVRVGRGLELERVGDGRRVTQDQLIVARLDVV